MADARREFLDFVERGARAQAQADRILFIEEAHLMEWQQVEERDGLELLIGTSSTRPRNLWFTVKGPDGAVTAMRYGSEDDGPTASYDFGVHFPAGNPLAGHDCELVDGGKCDFIPRGTFGAELANKLQLTAAGDRDETRWRILIESYRHFLR